MAKKRGVMIIVLFLILSSLACGLDNSKEQPTEPLLEIKVDPVTPRIMPGEDFKFNVSITKYGSGSVSIKNSYVILNSVDNAEEELEVWSSDELMNLLEDYVITKSVTMPKDLPLGLYEVEVTVKYRDEVSYASNTFRLDKPVKNMYKEPFIFVILFYLIGTPWLYIILILTAIGFFVGLPYYKALKKKKKETQRYVFPLDFSKLPKRGKGTIVVGRIAETKKPAYLDIDKLQTHILAAGATGSGKSVSVQIVAEELLLRKIPVIVFDPTFQWSGFAWPSKDKKMIDLYPKFGLAPTAARGFKTNVIVIEDPNMEIKIKDHMNPGEITVFSMHKLSISNISVLVKKTIDMMFDEHFDTTQNLRLLMIYDEVHRLLPKYGGKDAYTSLERGCREFRKWGIGIALISQVLMDFKAAVTTNIGTEIQLRTKYHGDIERVKKKYGKVYADTMARLQIGTGLMQNAEYNDGRPYFVSYRPLLHSTTQISEEAFNKMRAAQVKLDNLKKEITSLKKKGIDVYEIEMEFKLADDKVKDGNFDMADLYLDSVENKVKATR